MQVLVRPSTPHDIEAMHRVRLSVQENRLSQAAGITEESYLAFVRAGSAWVAELSGQVVGFAAVDVTSRTVWALFVDPGAEKLGIGKALHGCLVGWARERGLDQLTLVTSPGTRAAAFYIAAGWLEEGFSSTGELCFSRRLDIERRERSDAPPLAGS